MDARLIPHLTAQGGVVSRRQALDAGLTRENLDRLCRRRELHALFPRVYVDHTGTPTWDQLAWGAVLWGWPAVLSHESALGVAEGPTSPHRTVPVRITVDRDRRLIALPGIVVHRSQHVRTRSRSGSPPRIRYDEAAIDVVSRLDDEDAAVAELGRILQTRRTTPARLESVLRARVRARHRDLVEDVLGDLAAGVTSALERSFLHRVERAHGLPPARRQRREATIDGTVYRDVVHEVEGALLVVELDGHQFHHTVLQRDRDLDRDLATLVRRGQETVRLGWGQCRGRPCRTAGLLGAVLVGRGWRGRVSPCRAGCEAPDTARRAVAAAAA